MNNRRMKRECAAWAVLLCGSALCEAQPRFQGLGFLPDYIYSSGARGVSQDGSTVVGYSRSQNGPTQAIRWTLENGMVGLGFLPAPFNATSGASAVSGDGSVVVGGSSRPDFAGPQAFRWTAAGMVGLGFLPGTTLSSAYGVSGDGSVVVGLALAGGPNYAFRWTQGTGMQPIGSLIGPGGPSTAFGISPDGQHVVGWSSNSSGGTEAYIWNQSSGMQGLGDFPGGIEQSVGLAVSDSGVVVGNGINASGVTAFRWTQPSGLVPLDDLPGGPYGTSASAVSADGSLIVGSASADPALSRAVLWDALGHVRMVADVLTQDFGLNLNGWTLQEASGISADGRTIVGSGIDPHGKPEAWVAIIPSPGSMAFVVLGAAQSLRRRRRTSGTHTSSCVDHGPARRGHRR